MVAGEYSYDVLSKIGVHELRCIARELGVRCPTTKVKEELISQILAIASGKQKPYARMKIQGRPRSNTFSSNIIKELLPDDYYTQNDLFFMQADSFLSSPKNEIVKNGAFVGVLDISPAGYGFVRGSGESSFYISTHMIATNNLRNGDNLSVIAQELVAHKPWVVAEVKKVNGCDIEVFLKENKARFEQIAVEKADKLLELKGTSGIVQGVKYGQKVLVSVKPSANASDLVLSLVNSVANSNVVVLDATQLDVKNLSAVKNINLTALSPQERFEIATNKAKLALDVAVRSAEKGNNAIVIVDSLSKLFRSFNSLSFAEGVIYLDRVDSNAVNSIKKYFNTAKNTKNGSVTIIGLVYDKTTSPMDTFLYNELITTADAFIEVNNDLTVNKTNSYIK